MLDPRRPKFGLMLSGWINPEGNPTTQVRMMLERVPFAVEHGFTSVFVGQHILGHPWPVLDPTVYATSIAAVGSVEVGAVYIVPLLNPVLLAESLVSLDMVTGGRVIFAPVLGWAQREFDAMGIAMAERAGRFTEALEIIRRLWESDDEVTFEGKYYRFSGRMAARPVRPEGIPVWIGANAAPGVRRAARLGDAWIASTRSSFEELRHLTEVYNAALTAEGRTVGRRPLERNCMVAANDDEARQRFGTTFEAYASMLAAKTVAADRAASPPRVEDAVVGSPRTVVRQLERYRALGFDEFIFQVGPPGTPDEWVRESIRLLGSEVLPVLDAG